jgi:hypothetical protein
MNLTLRRTWPDRPRGDNHFEVVLNGTKGLARIMAEKRSDYWEVWGWWIYGFNAPSINGQAETFDEAKREAKRTF